MQSNNLKSIIGKELNFDDLQNITVGAFMNPQKCLF